MRKKNLEATLSRLEKRYDNVSAPTREFYADLRDIQELKREGLIDHGHAELLIEGATKARKAKEEARRPKSTYTYTKPSRNPLRGSGGAVAAGFDSAQQAVSAMVSLLFILWFAFTVVF